MPQPSCTFSIIMPTFNRPDTLPRAVASVLAQTFSDLELIIVDDTSSDAYAEALVRLDRSRIRVIRNRKNLGAAGARNVGIQAARGEYVSFLDDDDEYLSSFLASTHACLSRVPSEIALSWSGAQIIDYSDDSRGARHVRTREFPARYTDRTRLFEDLLSVGSGFGVSIKTDSLRRIGAFDVQLKTVEDADLFLRFLSAGLLPTVVPGVQIVLHNHNNRRLTAVANHEARIQECEWLLLRHAEFLERYPTLQRQLLFCIATLRRELSSANGSATSSPQLASVPT